MKKFLFSLVLALVTLGANAQAFGGGRPQMNPEDMAKRQVDRIKEACQTSDEQTKQIYDLVLAQQKQMMAQMDSIRQAGGQFQFNREEFQARREAMNEKIKAILTPEQYAKYEEQQRQMRERMGQGRRRN